MMTDIKPYIGWVSVVPEIPEEPKDKGPIAIHSVEDLASALTERAQQLADEMQPHTHSGIVNGVGEEIPHLKPGCKVYYLCGHGVPISDVVLLNASAIVAWEEA